MARRLPGRRGRLGGACARDRGAHVGRARPRRRAARSSRSTCARSWSRRRRTPPRWTAFLAHGRGRPADLPAAVEDLLRELAPQVLGVARRRYGDFDAAEDAVQEALLAAARHWPRDGVPDEPAGWLRHRRDTAADRPAAAASGPAARERGTGRRWSAAARDEPRSTGDDTLILLFLCCHPALTPAVGDRADAARRRRPDDRRDRPRLPRARGDDGAADQPRQGDDPRLRRARSRLPRPTRARRAPALRAARALPDLQRGVREHARRRRCSAIELSGEAIRLTRLLVAGVPDDPEVAGLLALMLLLDARRPARTDAAGRPRAARRAGPLALGPGARSPRASRCSIGAIAPRRRRRVPAAGGDRRRARPGRDAPRTPTGRRSSALYGLLEEVTGNPVVTLNRAVAAAMVDGPRGRARRRSTTVEDRLGRTLPVGRRPRPPARDGRRDGGAAEPRPGRGRPRRTRPSGATSRRGPRAAAVLTEPGAPGVLSGRPRSGRRGRLHSPG